MTSNRQALNQIDQLLDGYTWEWQSTHDTSHGLELAEEVLEKIADIVEAAKPKSFRLCGLRLNDTVDTGDMLGVK